jgi:hypothetical protein
MNHLSFRVLTLCALMSLCASNGQAADEKKAEWNQKMSEMMAALSDVAPTLFSTDQADEKMGEAFKVKLKKIVDLSRQIDQSQGHLVSRAPDDDPALLQLSRLFRQDMERAQESLDAGQVEYSRSVLKSSISYCIACHTRSQGGAQFPLIGVFSKAMEKASWLERLSLKAATRQFDEALADTMRAVETPTPSTFKPYDIERATKIGLMIAVRVKDSPERAMLLAEAVAKSKEVSDSLRQNAKTWIKDIHQWQKTKDKSYKTDRDMMTAAREILGRIDDQEGVRTDGAEIRHLRASNLMYSLLRQFPQSKFNAEALYLIGNSYDALGDLGYWNLGETYFQACIHKAPHSELAERCYGRYENSVTLGYTGSRGTVIPGLVKRQLLEIKDQAMRKKVDSKSGTK